MIEDCLENYKVLQKAGSNKTNVEKYKSCIHSAIFSGHKKTANCYNFVTVIIPNDWGN